MFWTTVLLVLGSLKLLPLGLPSLRCQIRYHGAYWEAVHANPGWRNRLKTASIYRHISQ